VGASVSLLPFSIGGRSNIAPSKLQLYALEQIWLSYSLKAV